MMVEPLAASPPIHAPFAEPTRRAGDRPTLFVGFRVDQHLYALPLDRVDRVLRMVAITPVPEAPRWVPGVIDMHGRVVPVVDLRRRLECPSKVVALDDRLLIVRTNDQTIALMVDAVTEMLEVPADHVELSGNGFSLPPHVAGVIRSPNSLILILRADRLLQSENEDTAMTMKGADVQLRKDEHDDINSPIE
jgi:purine-binding chemotaxis protein CheW